ncbi:MAG: LptF/LptG family permease [Gemmatimonadaceae bacterium]|jgi:lipopolysaccharide export system permease protein|nr:LptF/LptG family permease [Gemmatimonadaceae bacterium]
MLRALDRYVLGEFLRIFSVTALGFPILIIIGDVTEKLDTYLQRRIPGRDIALAYLYWIPDSMFIALPIAVLFATVFTVGSFTRYSEVSAAKASGISFYRFVLPIMLGATLAMGLGFLLNEVTPPLVQRRLELLQEKKFKDGTIRTNFAFQSEGRTLLVGQLDPERGTVSDVEITRRGRGPDFPTTHLVAQRGQWSAARGWTLATGQLHVVPDSVTDQSFAFDSLLDRTLRDRPVELAAIQKAPADMSWRELGRYITALERSGSNVNQLRVERMLKFAIPVTCVIIFLFGAPLATSNQRGGATWGIGISLLVTVIFLVLVQLMRGVGNKGLIPPDLAAWVPTALFGVIGVVLLARVRT